MILDPSFLNSLGIAKVGYTEESKALSYSLYEKWVSNGYAGPLNYLTDHRKELRKDIKLYFNEFKSALVCLFPYVDEKKAINQNPSPNKIASYVTGFEGVDYHYWIKEKLTLLAEELQKEFGDFKYAFTIDAQPVLERDLAQRAGLGWIGKNSMLINKEHGSFFIISSLLLSKKLDLSESPLDVDHCGNCNACIDACPTNAIIENERTVNSSLCISTFTIELFKESSPPSGYDMTSEIYGCDICQDVCPWNRRPLANAKVTSSDSVLKDFFKRDALEIFKDINTMSNREFKRKFKGTPLERTGRVGVLKNISTRLKKG